VAFFFSPNVRTSSLRACAQPPLSHLSVLVGRGGLGDRILVRFTPLSQLAPAPPPPAFEAKIYFPRPPWILAAAYKPFLGRLFRGSLSLRDVVFLIFLPRLSVGPFRDETALFFPSGELLSNFFFVFRSENAFSFPLAALFVGIALLSTRFLSLPLSTPAQLSAAF